MKPAKAAFGPASNTSQCHVGFITPRPVVLLYSFALPVVYGAQLRAAMDPPFKEVPGGIGRFGENGVGTGGPVTCE